MKILVTGATGKLGSKVVEALLKVVPASDLAVSVRNPEKAEGLKNRGVEVRQGDFDHPETLNTAFAEVDRLLIISADGDNETRIRQHSNAVAAAKEANVKFIAYTSVGNASESSLFLAPVHRATEEAILKTGIPYCFLRNNWYLENEIGSIQGVMAGAPWLTSAGTGKVGWALQQDYAEAAATVLSGNGFDNTIFELSGEPMSQEDLAASLGAVLGKEVAVHQVDDATYADAMKGAGVPDFVVPMLVDIQKAIRDGALDIKSNDFEKLLGRKATPISEGLAQIINALK
ncbi:SDR family oxidoreductase [Clostridium fungisolvens]|uniref:Quinone oxidoreductase 2 n=1 Tax=Clostridium fungisolvens TaxID=1604897 RepID=A0A6V8SMC1_9CLOT|nr:SDR family oxidoreductase [Clostridium fungisolvens]GFP76318.1 Quinone oxidoreductase 2 [Clostridium fungisolvens]